MGNRALAKDVHRAAKNLKRELLKYCKDSGGGMPIELSYIGDALRMLGTIELAFLLKSSGNEEVGES